jgi:hypothetical protein
MNDQKENLRDDQSRAPYAQPELTRLGTMAELTQAVANKKNNDGGKGTLKRSQ